MKRILFVDDEPNVLAALQNILRRQRKEWDMVFASGGQAALDELAKGPFDVIVSDMRMPGIDGAALLSRVKEQYPTTARLVLSGHAEGDALVRALPVAHQFLAKPCEASVLTAVIARACELQGLLQDDAIRRVVGRVDRLPSVPRTYVELTQAIASPDVGINEIARIVEGDPAIAVKVLQLVNSAYFGLPRHVLSVREAVAYIGVEVLRGLSLAAGLFSRGADAPATAGLSLEALQHHAFMTAKVAKQLARDPKHAEEAYTAALMHDIGKNVLALCMPKEFAESIRAVHAGGEAPVVVEKQMFGVTHAEIGAYLLGVWGLPLPIVEAVAFHHAPSNASDGARETIAIVHVADALVQEIDHPALRRFDGALLDQAFLEKAGVADRLPAWRATAEAECNAVKKKQEGRDGVA